MRCRERYKNLSLYWHSKKPVSVSECTIQYLKENIHRMDVWCDTCEKVINTRVTGEGRLNRKKEAIRLADISLFGSEVNTFDETVLSGRKTATKRQLHDYVKELFSCKICGIHLHPCAMEFHHIDKDTKITAVSQMINFSSYTFNSLVLEIQKCCLLCVVCHRYVENDLLDSPKDTIILDDTFWEEFISSL